MIILQKTDICAQFEINNKFIFEAIYQIKNSFTCEHTSMSKVMEIKEVCDRIYIEAKEGCMSKVMESKELCDHIHIEAKEVT